MRHRDFIADERGLALVVTLFVVMVVAGLVTGAALLGSNHILISRYHDRIGALELAADAGLELGRSMINADNDLYPDDGYTVLEDGAAVQGPDGEALPGVRRWLYAGPSGVTSGQYGIFGSIVSVVEDPAGGIVVRRLQVNQESFAKYAYFTDYEPSNIRFGGGDQIWGPVHSNSPLRFWSSGATFHGETRTAQNVVDGHYATFMQGYEEYVPVIPMPDVADLNRLRTQAQAGNTYFAGDGGGGHGQATSRIEFVAVDLNGDGDRTDADEGFIKVYQNFSRPYHVVADRVSRSGVDMYKSRVCGAVAPDGEFYTFNEFRTGADGTGWNVSTAVNSSTRRCYPGGHHLLNRPDGFSATDGQGGQWVAWGGPVDPRLPGAMSALGRAGEENYLHPVTRPLNPAFKGVVFVDGKVGISGELRGRVTVAATNDIVLVDDYTYMTDPGAGTCEDILGIFSGDDIVVTDNTINEPQPGHSDSGGATHYTFDDTAGEFFHGVVLALDVFTVENYSSGPTWQEPCEGTWWGRGCLYLTGGIIQRTRGAVGTGAGTGYLKRYSYDKCAAEEPPPYFPTTGYFVKNQYFQIDPAGFDVDEYWALITPFGS